MCIDLFTFLIIPLIFFTQNDNSLPLMFIKLRTDYQKIEDNRKRNALETTLRRHDRIALAERRRRHLIKDLSFGEACRCCHDQNDGGEYTALIELRASLSEQNQENQEDLDLDHQDYENHAYERKVNNDSDNDDSDDDSEFDYLLDEDLPGGGESDSQLQLLQQERMAELQLSAIMRESAMQHGFGVHRQFHPQRVLYAAGLGLEGKARVGVADIPPAAVIHLNEDNVLSASLDLCLEEMALNRYRGTKFVRSYGRSTMTFNAELVQRVFPKMKKDSSLPALIAVKDGVVVSICENLSLFVAGGGNTHSCNKIDDAQVEPRAVEEWLDRTGVLLHDVPIDFEDYCRIRPEEDSLLQNMMREKARIDEINEESIFQCGVPGCRKTFHHEHVGVKNEEQSGLVVSKEKIEESKIEFLDEMYCQETAD